MTPKDPRYGEEKNHLSSEQPGKNERKQKQKIVHAVTTSVRTRGQLDAIHHCGAIADGESHRRLHYIGLQNGARSSKTCNFMQVSCDVSPGEPHCTPLPLEKKAWQFVGFERTHAPVAAQVSRQAAPSSWRGYHVCNERPLLRACHHPGLGL